jgi:hypothetical protein
MRVRTSFIAGGARAPRTPGVVFYTCRRWPDCDLEEEEFIPAHKFNRYDPPRCPLHLTTPMDKEVRKGQARQ